MRSRPAETTSAGFLFFPLLLSSFPTLLLSCYPTLRMPSYHIITYGCQMNKNDSQRIETLLKGMGLEPTLKKDEADVIIINTCSVRQSAEDRIFGHVRDFKIYKEKNPRLVIGITGCMPGRDKDGAIRKRLPIVDLYFPTADMNQLPRWLCELRPEFVNSSDLVKDYLKIRPDRAPGAQAFVSIQTGCNKYCSYCVVPFSRGREKNRPLADILAEVRDLASHGVVEILLLGQTVNSYRAPDPESISKNNPYHDHFAALLWEINQIPGISRLHFTGPHPIHMNDETIDAMTLPAHMNFIHLPVQAGDDEVLRRMNRRYTSAQYLSIIDRLRVKIPGIAIGTDIIVGFCGETQEQFKKTVELYEKVRFDISYTARYSFRSGTLASRAFKDNVGEDEKKRRWNVLQEVQERIALEKNQEYVGKTMSVLVDRFEREELADVVGSGFCFGNSRETKLVRFRGNEQLIGKEINVKINKAQTWILEGEIL